MLGERARSQPGAKPWDQFLSRWMATLGPLTIWIVSGLDFRYSWSTGLPIWAIVVSISLVFIGGLIVLWAMAENHFFVGMVRIQTERGHQVISSGPYRFMRHPGYLDSILYLAFTPLALDSLWGLRPAMFTVGVVLLRTYFEDQTLIEELFGYQASTEQVHYRLIPGLW